MKVATKNNIKQNKLTNFFAKLPKDEPLKDCSNTLEVCKKDDLKNNKVAVDKISCERGPLNKAQKEIPCSPHKRNNESDENSLPIKKIKLSPHKCSSSMHAKQKTIDDFNLSDLGDEFFHEIPEIENGLTPCNLNLTKLDRYRVEKVEVTSCNEIRLTVQNLVLPNKGSCIVKSPWNACTVHPGDVVSLKGRWSNTGDNPCWIVDWDGGVLVTNPDHLISGTTIVNSLYCNRKTVLSHMFKEQETSTKSSTAMLVGCVVHELLQKALTSKKKTLDEIEELFSTMKNCKDFKVKLFLENFNFEEVTAEISEFIPKIYDFICKYVNLEESSTRNSRFHPDKSVSDWQGEIVGVKDIEENIWSHRLGIKGKIDVTVQAKIRNKVKIVPLELKTGKVSPLNLEHRGQVILYCMMLQEMGENVDSGLLLYLRDEGRMVDVNFGERERRDLVLLRNGLSYRLKKLSSVEPGPNISPPHLPQVINRSSCQTCPQLLACSSALRRSGDIDSLDDSHILKKLALDATSHLTDQHLQYVFHWLGLLSLEFEMSKYSVSRIWSYEPAVREAKGWCLSQLKVSSSSLTKSHNWEVIFVKMDCSEINCSFDVGQTVVVGNDSHIAIVTGFITEVTNMSITIKTDKDLKQVKSPIYVDIYESSSINLILMNNLSLLLQNTPQGDSLRKSIIDLKIPSFATKLSSKIKKVAQDIFDRLNNEQIRAILQVIAAEQYILIKGMPGAGKTTTMRALIELLVRLGKTVLVTSFTHSAIDNILLGLPLLESGKVLRLGPLRRIHPVVARYAAEDNLLNDVSENVTFENLEDVYRLKQVVGVTCLGCGHPWLERQRFDVCLVDEATQVNQPTILKPLSLANKFILVGDPKQLPPMVICNQARENGLAVSLFEKLDRPAVTSRLTLQYRMNSFITEVANGFAYGGELKCGSESVANNVISYTDKSNCGWPEWMKVVLDKTLEKSVVVIDVENKVQNNSGTCDNKAEANVIYEITKALQEVKVNLKTVGVIAAYRDQVNLLREMLHPDIEVNTVDQYQGRDKELILFSTTKSSKISTCNDILNDTNRLTVAITRAKMKLIIIGNLFILRNYSNFTKLLTLIPTENVIKYLSLHKQLL